MKNFFTSLNMYMQLLFVFTLSLFILLLVLAFVPRGATQNLLVAVMSTSLFLPLMVGGYKLVDYYIPGDLEARIKDNPVSSAIVISATILAIAIIAHGALVMP